MGNSCLTCGQTIVCVARELSIFSNPSLLEKEWLYILNQISDFQMYLNNANEADFEKH